MSYTGETDKQMGTLKDVLAVRTREGELYDPLDRNRVHCYACGHDCRIPNGAYGVCKVRFNEGGRLLVPWGYAGGVQCPSASARSAPASASASA